MRPSRCFYRAAPYVDGTSGVVFEDINRAPNQITDQNSSDDMFLSNEVHQLTVSKSLP